MTARQFPDDQEIDQWISTHFLDETDTDASPVLDQVKAATNDAVNRFRANAPVMVMAGLAERYFEVPDPDRSKIRGAVRQLMVAISAGVLPLCPHVQQIRPLILVCDPPVVVCRGCFASRRAVIETLGHRWNHQCDRCGVHVEKLTPLTIGGLGHITITGHICGRCTDDDQRQAGADLASRTGNRQARRRGGAR
jgi:hypothetical protein